MDIQENDPEFFFSLSIEGINLGPASIFNEVSGIPTNDHLDVTDAALFPKSGLLPHVTRGSNLMLKRGFIPIGSGLDLWCSATLGDFSKQTVMHTLLLSLRAKDGQVLKSWEIGEANIVSCKVLNDSPVAGQKNIESIEFAYNSLTVA